MTIRPFPFDALERRSKQIVDSSNRLLDHYYLRGEELQSFFAKAMGETLGAGCWLQVTHVGPVQEGRVLQDASTFGWWGLLHFGEGMGAIWIDEFAIGALPNTDTSELIRDLLSSLSQQGIAPPSLSSEPPRAAAIHSARTEAHLRVRGVVGIKERVGSFELYFPDLSPNLVDLPVPERVADSIGITCPVDAAWALVAPRELSHLGPRDVLLFDSHAFTAASKAVVPARLGLASDFWLSGSLVTEHHHWRIGITMENDAISPASSASAPDLTRRAKVEVSLRLGSLELTMRELATLQPGKVLELNTAVGDPVEIVAGGRVLATGELINIDGRVGVQIVKLSG